MKVRIHPALALALVAAIAMPALADDVVVQLGAGDDFVVRDDGNNDRLGVNGATGDVAVTGTVDGVSIAAHDHSTGTGQTRLSAGDRRRVAVWHKDADAAAADPSSEQVVFTAPDDLTITNVFVSPSVIPAMLVRKPSTTSCSEKLTLSPWSKTVPSGSVPR